MGIVIYNNLAALNAKNVLGNNVKNKNDAAGRFSTGLKIRSASDDASAYQIRERMRVSIRASEQNERNVQNGAALLRVAQGGIQEQIELGKRVKALVIAANNGILTARDIAAIQGEIDQSLEQMQDTAYMTNYNRIPLLTGHTLRDEKVDYIQLENPAVDSSTFMGLVTTDPTGKPYNPGAITESCKFSEYVPLKYDFRSYTQDQFRELAGRSFILQKYDLDGKPVDGTAQEFMFVDPARFDKSTFPPNVIAIDLRGASDSGYNAATVATNFSEAIGTKFGYSDYSYDKTLAKQGVATISSNSAKSTLKFQEVTSGAALDGTDVVDEKLFGGDGDQASFTLDLSAYNTRDKIAALEGKGFYYNAVNSMGVNVGGNTYVFSAKVDPDAPDYPRYPANVIDISDILAGIDDGTISVVDITKKLAEKVSTSVDIVYATDVAKEDTVVFTADHKGDIGNRFYLESYSILGSGPTPGGTYVDAAASVGLKPNGGKLTGGSYANPGDADLPPTKDEKPKLTLDCGAFGDDTGFVLHGKAALDVGKTNSEAWLTYVRFSDKMADGTMVNTLRPGTGNYQTIEVNVKEINKALALGKDFTFAVDGINITISQKKDADGKPIGGNQITFEGVAIGPEGNNFFEVRDGIEEITYTGSPGYGTVDPFPVNGVTGLEQHFTGGADTKKAFKDIMVGDYAGKDEAIKKLAGTSFYFNDLSDIAVKSTWNHYEFIDSTSSDPKIAGGTNPKSLKIDLSKLTDGRKETIAKLIADELQRQGENRVTADGTGNLKFESAKAGINGNDSIVKGYGSYDLALKGSEDYAKYTIDLKGYLEANKARIDAAGGIQKFLDHKGFRTDCSSCGDQCFNFEFVIDPAMANPSVDDKMTNYPIDISSVTDVDSLLDAIQASLTKPLKDRNHFMNVSVNKDKGSFTMYDDRFSYRANNARIHDGILSDWARLDKSLYLQEIPIQHMERSNQIIMLQIPCTELNRVFGDMESFLDVNYKRNREIMLGDKLTKGVLDEGLEYLMAAAALVGAQEMRMEFAEQNITSRHENTTHSESAISDADMAKEYVSFTKSGILQQASQAMLAQANQSQQIVLSLLQSSH